MTNERRIEIGKGNPDKLIGTTVTVGCKTGVVKGWGRIDSSASGQRYVGFGFYHTSVRLKLESGDTVYATIISDGRF